MLFRARALGLASLVLTLGIACGSPSTDDEASAAQSSDETASAKPRKVSFLVGSDLHFGWQLHESIFADEVGVDPDSVDVDVDEPDDEDEDGNSVSEVDATAADLPSVRALNRHLAAAMNSLSSAANGKLLADLGMSNDFKGVIITGDVTDDGRGYQWGNFVDTYGFAGTKDKTKALNWPVYETAGNHDYSWRSKDGVYKDPTDVYVLRKVLERTAKRENVVAKDAGGSYAFKWGDVLFVNLGVKASDDNGSMIKRTNGKETLYRNTNPFHSLSFLSRVLKDTKASTPIVLSFHYPIHTSVDRFDDAERDALFETIKGHHVIAMIHGHRHISSHYEWCGIPVYEVDTPRSALRHGYDSSFLAVDIDDNRIKATTVTWNVDSDVVGIRAKPTCNVYNKKDACWTSAKELTNIPVPDKCPNRNVDPQK